MTTTYRLWLPIFKQGDDLRGYLDQNAPKDAFLKQAKTYEEAARLCRVMAGVAAEDPSLTVHAETHLIQIESDDTARLDALVTDRVLEREVWEDEEDEITETYVRSDFIDPGSNEE